MLSAIRPCLSQGEQTRLDTLMRVMDAREILIQKEGLDGLDKGTNGSAGRGTAAADPGSSGIKQGYNRTGTIGCFSGIWRSIGARRQPFQGRTESPAGGSISESAGRRPRTDAADHGTYGIVK